MARKPRVDFEGAFYHVIVRGNQRQDIFRDDKDRAIYLDEEFIEKVDKRTQGQQVEAGGPKVPFGRPLEAVAKEHGVGASELTGGVRRKQWVRARAMLVYLAREWSKVTSKELAGRLHRDASLMSRLCAMYERDRGKQAETRMARLAGKKISP